MGNSKSTFFHIYIYIGWFHILGTIYKDVYYILCNKDEQCCIIGHDFKNHRWKDFKNLVTLRDFFMMQLVVCNHHLFAIYICDKTSPNLNESDENKL